MKINKPITLKEATYIADLLEIELHRKTNGSLSLRSSDSSDQFLAKMTVLLARKVYELEKEIKALKGGK